jgi:hypothetical protein
LCTIAAVGLVSTVMSAAPAGAAAIPKVAAVSPNNGSTLGGTRVTVTGTGLNGVTAVRFGATAGTHVNVVSSTLLQVISPAHATGVVNVRVVSKAGTSAAVLADHYQFIAPPTVTSVSPKGGTSAGGTTVTVKGTSFRHVAAVRFGAGFGTNVVVTSPTTLTTRAPIHTQGQVDVTVVTAYGQSAVTAADHYTFLAHTPPNPVTSVLVTARTTSSLTLSWTNPTNLELTGVLVRRAVGSTPPASVSDGTLVADVAAPSHSVTDNGLTPGTTYSYAFFAHDVVPNYSTPTGRTTATSPSTGTVWAAPVVIDSSAAPTSVSCPTTTFCVALDSKGRALTFDGTAWSAPVLVSDSPKAAMVRCSTPTFCMAFAGNGQVVTFNGSTWTAPFVVDAVAQTNNIPWLWQACSPSFCMAVEASGSVVRYDGATAHVYTNIGIHARSVSCPSATFCMAVDGLGGYVTFNGSTWSSASTIASPPCSPGDCALLVTCSSSSFCLAGSYTGGPALTWNGSTWMAVADLAAYRMYRAVCPADGSCLLLNLDRDTTTLSGSTWSPLTAPDPNYLTNDVSCATPTFCVAVAGPNAIIGT